MQRYARAEKLTQTRFNPHIMVTLPSAETSNSVVSQPNDVVNIAWVERKDVMGMYPALAVAIQNLQALPYEINGTSCCLL